MTNKPPEGRKIHLVGKKAIIEESPVKGIINQPAQISSQMAREVEAILTASTLITEEEIKLYAKGEDRDRVIRMEPSAQARAQRYHYGCASSHGSKELDELDDGIHVENNEDFAFAVEMEINGELWVMAGVADGVSQSVWSPLGSKLAAKVFIKAVQQTLQAGSLPEKNFESFRRTLAQNFYHMWNQGREEMMAILEKKDARGNYLIPFNYGKEFYNEQMERGMWQTRFDRGEWFQTTLSAVAMGPKNGFGIFISDGSAQVRRNKKGDKTPNIAHPRQTSGKLGGIEASGIERLTLRIEPDNAEKLEVRVATDGINDGFTSEEFSTSTTCESYIARLSQEYPHGHTDSTNDNMSVAFISRTFET